MKQTPGSIGYVELIYALQNKISYGAVQNAAGEFVKAIVESVTAAAAAAAAKMPADFRVSITNAPGEGAYPISSFTWLLLYENPKDKAQAKMMVDFMKWALTDGQKFAAELGYAPLPAAGRRAGADSAGEDQGCSSAAMSDARAPRPTRSRLPHRDGRVRARRSIVDRRGHRRSSCCAAVACCRSRSSAGSSGGPTPGIRSPASSARGRSSGARSIRRSWRCCIATPIALGIAIFISELCPAWLRQPLVFLTELLAAIPSIVYGLWGIFVLVPLVRQLEVGDAGLAAGSCRSSAGRRSASACCRRR